MSVWQYQLNIIPRSAIIEKYGEIPNKLFIDEKGWKDYWDNPVLPRSRKFNAV